MKRRSMSLRRQEFDILVSMDPVRRLAEFLRMVMGTAPVERVREIWDLIFIAAVDEIFPELDKARPFYENN